jgi:hypothetical protein
MEFRNLRPDEIECRVQSVKQNGVSLTLYKDARCDMRILDETVGPENWQKEFYECKGTLFCRVGIRVRRTFQTMVEPYDEWVWKSDAGEPSNTSAQKGEASDAFKRACFNWSIGRELYSSPFLWIPESACRIQNARGKYVCYDRFSVADMSVRDGKIVYLKIVNESTFRVCYEWGRK